MSSGTRNGQDGDLGLFGPESVTWRVHLEPVLWVGGFRALYLQALHPRVIRGTAQNSKLFDPEQAWGRFQRTADFVGTRTFSSTDEVERAARRVRRIHSRLTGHDPDTGTDFRIDDVQNLLWVHCGEIDSYVEVARRSGILTRRADADRYVAESRRAAEVIGIPAEQAPGSLDELADYYQRIRPELYATREAVQSLVRSFNPRVPRNLTPLKAVIPPIGALAFATLPRWARRLYGAPGLPTTDLGATVALRGLRQTLAMLPDLPGSPDADRARRLVREAKQAS